MPRKRESLHQRLEPRLVAYRVEPRANEEIHDERIVLRDRALEEGERTIAFSERGVELGELHVVPVPGALSRRGQCQCGGGTTGRRLDERTLQTGRGIPHEQ